MEYQGYNSFYFNKKTSIYYCIANLGYGTFSDTLVVTICNDSSFISIDTPTIFILTAFTPNDDALNDILHINNKGINPTSWQIYNRWCNKVYCTQNTFEWDGYQNGKHCESGTYYYVLRYTKKNLNLRFLKVILSCCGSLLNLFS
jgi:gliding motility-associated-like protein